MNRIEVRRHGSKGHQVVVLHGGPGAIGSAVGLARGLAAEFRVLEPLQRRSGAVPLTVSRHVQDLAEVVERPSAIVGHSWGAMLGLSFAAQHPDRASCLALVGCGAYDEESRKQFRMNLDERMDERTRNRIRALKEQRRAERELDARNALIKELGALTMSVEAYEPIQEQESLDDTLAFDAGANSETWQDVLRLQSLNIEPQIFAKIACPVFMLHGAFDPHPGALTRDRLRAFIPQLEYVEFEKCGHEPWKERHARAAFFGALQCWLSQTLAA